MPQLSLYLDDATMETLRKDARAEGVSMSRYAATLVQDRAHSGVWPNGYWETVYGCLDEDFCIPEDDLRSDLDDMDSLFDEGK